MIQLWKDKILAKELRNNALSDKDKLFYLVSLSVLELFNVLVERVFHASFPETPTWQSQSKEMLIDIAIYSCLILILYTTFKTNLRAGGTNFIERFFCLSVPCAIRSTVFTLLFGIAWILVSFAMGAFSVFLEFPEDSSKIIIEWLAFLAMVSTMIFSFAYYGFRMNKMFKIASGQME